MERHVYLQGVASVPIQHVGLVQRGHRRSPCRQNETCSHHDIADILLIWRLRNKSWKPDCVLSFNMDWRVLVFTNIHQPMLKLKAHSGFHDLFRF